MSNHTATPWQVAAGSGTMIIGDRIPCIAETHNNGALENAEFIVRACNSHDDLVSALRDAASTMHQHDPMKARILDVLVKARGAE